MWLPITQQGWFNGLYQLIYSSTFKVLIYEVASLKPLSVLNKSWYHKSRHQLALGDFCMLKKFLIISQNIQKLIRLVLKTSTFLGPLAYNIIKFINQFGQDYDITLAFCHSVNLPLDFKIWSPTMLFRWFH